MTETMEMSPLDELARLAVILHPEALNERGREVRNALIRSSKSLRAFAWLVERKDA